MSGPIITSTKKNIAGLNTSGKLGYSMDSKDANFVLPCFKLEPNMVYYIEKSITIRRDADEKYVKHLPSSFTVDDVIFTILSTQYYHKEKSALLWLSHRSCSIKTFFGKTL